MEFFKHPTRPIEIKKDLDFDDFLLNLRFTGFQGRSLGKAFEIWEQMIREDRIFIMMGLSGALIPAGMRKVIVYLIEKRFIDCIVTTGANIFHDIVEAFGKHHYLGSPYIDDAILLKHGIDRIYDIYAKEEEFIEVDKFIADTAKYLKGETMGTREYLWFLANKIRESTGDRGVKDSFVLKAQEMKIPIYCPAISDSSIGIGLTHAFKNGVHVSIDTIKDTYELGTLVHQSDKTGVIFLGGGVPKNYIQQTRVITAHWGGSEGHTYAIQFTTDSPHHGGLSGATFEEAISWGKITPHGKSVQVFVDATIALPLIAYGLEKRCAKKGYRENFPSFKWGSDKATIMWE